MGSDNAAKDPDAFTWNIALQRMWAEFLGMTIFVFVSIAPACGLPAVGGANAKVFQVAFTFGIAIFVLACTIGHHSGGQMNCAVTLALVIAGEVTPVQGVLNFIAQVLGSFSAALLLWAVFPANKDATASLGSNMISDGYEWYNALIGEIFMTFILVFVVFETAVNPASSRTMAPLAIGLAVFLGHSVLIPIDGCSINPTRSLGPAIVASIRESVTDEPHATVDKIWEDHWVFWVGPLVGATIAALMAKFWWHAGITEDKGVEPSNGGDSADAIQIGMDEGIVSKLCHSEGQPKPEPEPVNPETQTRG